MLELYIRLIFDGGADERGAAGMMSDDTDTSESDDVGWRSGAHLHDIAAEALSVGVEAEARFLRHLKQELDYGMAMQFIFNCVFFVAAFFLIFFPRNALRRTRIMMGMFVALLVLFAWPSFLPFLIVTCTTTVQSSMRLMKNKK